MDVTPSDGDILPPEKKPNGKKPETNKWQIQIRPLALGFSEAILQTHAGRPPTIRQQSV